MGMLLKTGFRPLSYDYVTQGDNSMNGKMLNALKEYEKSDEIISIFSECDDEKFSCVQIISVDKDVLLGRCFGVSGEFQGYTSRQLSQIYSIRVGSDYENRIARLSRLEAVKQHTADLMLQGSQPGDVLLLKHAMDTHRIVTLEFCGSGYDDAQGYIQSLGPEYVEISLRNSSGNKNGIVIVDMDCISSITCDSVEERTLEILCTE